MSQDIPHKALRNIFFSVVRLVLNAFATLGTSIILAHGLGPSNLGEYSWVIWLAGTLGLLANLGLPPALTKYISEYVGRGEMATAIKIAKSLLNIQLGIAALVTLATAGASFFSKSSHVLIVLAAILVFFQAMQQAMSGALAGLQRFDRIALICLQGSIAQVVCIIAAATLHCSVRGMLWATIAGSAATCWFFYRGVSELITSQKESLQQAAAPTLTDLRRKIGTFSATISYVLLLDTIVWQRSEVLFLKWYSTLPEIAFYSIAYSIASKMSDLSGTFSATLLPLYSEHFGRSGMSEMGGLLAQALKYLQTVMVFPCFLAAALCGPVVVLIYGKAYAPIALPLEILIGCLTVTSIGVVCSPLLVGTERQSFIAKYGTVIAVLNITLDFFLIPKYGAVGASVANCTSQIAGVIGGTLYVFHICQARFPWKIVLSIYFSATVAIVPVILVAHLVPNTIVWLCAVAVLAVALNFALLHLTGNLGAKELAVLKNAFLKRPSSADLVKA